MDFKTGIAKALASISNKDVDEINQLIEVPPNRNMGDYAFPCFTFAKTMKKAPNIISQEWADKMDVPDHVKKIEVAGPYINFFIDPNVRAQRVLKEIRDKKEKYGSSDMGKGKVVTMDYSSINIAKPFHIGHLSSTVIGHALYNLYGFLGYSPVGINHLGDWGTQFGKLIVAFREWGNHEIIESGGVRELLKIYVKFHDEAKKNESLNQQARDAFKKIEENDAESVELFEWFKKLTLKEVAKIYDILDIKFDSYAGESFYNDKMDRVVEELREKKLIKEDQGAWVVEFDQEEKMPPCLILKADGATLYATRDIAAAIYRKEYYHFYKSLYVVAYQQNLHFKQVFRVLDMMGYEWAKEMEHVAFGMVSMEEGTLSTRSGRVIFLDEVFEKAQQRARDLIDEKSPDLENKDRIAQQVGVGALVYNTLSASRIKDITFSWDRALNFEGETGPYCQYTHARACSVLRKADEALDGDIDYNQLSDQYAQDLIVLLESFPSTIIRAVNENEPFFVTRQITSIAQAYSKFYSENRILDAMPQERKARLELTHATCIVIKTGLRLIGLAAPERM